MIIYKEKIGQEKNSDYITYKIIVRLRHLLILNSVLGLGNTKSVSTNGEVERFVRTVKKVIKTANVERKSWK